MRPSIGGKPGSALKGVTDDKMAGCPNVLFHTQQRVSALRMANDVSATTFLCASITHYLVDLGAIYPRIKHLLSGQKVRSVIATHEHVTK